MKMALLWGLRGALAHPIRSVSAALGMFTASLLFVAILGVSATVTAQVADSFDVTEASTLRLNVEGDLTADDRVPLSRFDDITKIPGVNSIGAFDLHNNTPVLATPFDFHLDEQLQDATTIRTDYRSLATFGLRIRGNSFIGTDDSPDTARQVALIGSGLAQQLNITHPSGSVTVYGQTFTIIGIIDDALRLPSVLSAIVIPRAATAEVGRQVPSKNAEVGAIVDIQPGSGEIVAGPIPGTLLPTHRDDVKVSVPPNPQSQKRSVNGSLQAATLGATGAIFFGGIVMIANLMFVSVLSRVGEFGMRRALGASKLDVAVLVMGESLTLGVIAGIVGTIAGTWVVLIYAISQHTTAVIDPWLLPQGIAVALIGSALGGLIPAIAAARVQAATALRFTG